jgi:hypothetical protein
MSTGQSKGYAIKAGRKIGNDEEEINEQIRRQQEMTRIAQGDGGLKRR